MDCAPVPGTGEYLSSDVTLTADSTPLHDSYDSYMHDSYVDYKPTDSGKVLWNKPRMEVKWLQYFLLSTYYYTSFHDLSSSTVLMIVVFLL